MRPNLGTRRLGRNRVRVIAEAFRPKPGGGFRPATLDELRPQLATYDGFPIYLFEGPRYVTPALIDGLELFGIGYSWGGYESLAIPVDLDRIRSVARRSYPGPIVRLQIGLEDPDDLIADLAAGLDRFRQHT